MVILQNKRVAVEIDPLGATMKTLVKDGKNYLWRGLPEIWGGTAPILFPICGSVKDDTYTYEGTKYHIQKHGYIRFCTFTVEEQNATQVTFLHVSDDETKKCYPFDYEFRACFALTDDGVAVTYKVKNTGDRPMYFSLGSHEGYATPDGIEDYDIIFPQKETLNTVMLDGALLQKHTAPILKNSYVLPLYDKYFTFDSLVFKDMKSKSLTMRNRRTGSFVKVDFEGKPYFVLWHKHGAPFMCLEPWCGLPDNQDTDGDITKKEGIISLACGNTYEITHNITVGEGD